MPNNAPGRVKLELELPGSAIPGISSPLAKGKHCILKLLLRSVPQSISVSAVIPSPLNVGVDENSRIGPISKVESEHYRRDERGHPVIYTKYVFCQERTDASARGDSEAWPGDRTGARTSRHQHDGFLQEVQRGDEAHCPEYTNSLSPVGLQRSKLHLRAELSTNHLVSEACRGNRKGGISAWS